MPPEEIQVVVGAALTIAVLSYLIGDNPVYRFAMHILVGVGAAYAVGAAVYHILYLRMWLPLTSQTVEGYGRAFGVFGLIGMIFLVFKLFPRVAWLGNAAVGYVLGVGAGLAVGGALFGTLAPQTLAATASLLPSAGGPAGVLVNVLILISTMTTLVAFAYSRSVQRSAVGRISALGRSLLHVALGATFALVFIAGASVLMGWLRDLLVHFSLVRGG